MTWYKNNAFYSCRIHGHQLSLPVVLAITRHLMTDSLISRPEETIRSSALTSSELQASKFCLWTLILIPSRQLSHKSINTALKAVRIPHPFFSFFFHWKLLTSTATNVKLQLPLFGSGSAPSAVLQPPITPHLSFL